MAQGPGLAPVEYIDRFFDELRAEVRSNPALAARLVKALGGNVVFEDETRADIADPYALGASATKAQFFAAFGSMKLAQLKKMLKDHNLVTRADMNGKAANQLVAMMYERALNKVSERRSSSF
jgi:hypothetical protein